MTDDRSDIGSSGEKEELFHDYYDGKRLRKMEAQLEFESQLRSAADPEIVASQGGETQGRPIAEATIITEDVTESSGSMGPEDKVEESDGSSASSVEKETEVASEDTSPSEAVEAGSVPGWRWLKKHQKAVGALLVAICVSLVAYGISSFATSRQEVYQKMTPVQVYRGHIGKVGKGKTDILNFARFVVLFPEEDSRAYLSLSISIEVSDSDAEREISEKITVCRGAIYAVLNKAVNTSNKQMICKEKLKQDIMDVLNGMVGTGTIDSICFTEFLMV